MNLLDNIVWFLVLTLLLSVSVNYIWSLTNISYIAQSNFESTSILEKTELVLRQNMKTIDVDKNKVWYKKIFKNNFILNTFEWEKVNLWSNIKEWNTFSCYNYNLNGLKINIYKPIDIDNKIDFDWDYKKTDEDWENPWTEFINILCMYSTYEYLDAGNIINTDDAPISYVIYSFYKDLMFNQRIIEKKWILYFN